MSDPNSSRAVDSVTRIPEERAAKILERAAALDAKRSSEFDLEQLREAAADAGISREAFEEALAEQGEGPGRGSGGRGARTSVQLRGGGPGVTMADASYYSGLLRDLFGDEGDISVTDVIEWRDRQGMTATLAPGRTGVSASVTVEGRLKRRMLALLWSVLPILAVTFLIAMDEDEAVLMFFGALIALALGWTGLWISDRREKKELRKKAERMRRQLARILGGGAAGPLEE